MKRIKADDDKTPEQKSHEAIFNFCIYSGLDFNIVRSPYFQAMLDAIANVALVTQALLLRLLKAGY